MDKDSSKPHAYYISAGHTNQLTPATVERLDYLTEELAEAIQAIAKIKRHGWTATDYATAKRLGQPPITYYNRIQLETELLDVMKAICRLVQANEIADPTRYNVLDINNEQFHHQEPVPGEK